MPEITVTATTGGVELRCTHHRITLTPDAADHCDVLNGPLSSVRPGKFMYDHPDATFTIQQGWITIQSGNQHFSAPSLVFRDVIARILIAASRAQQLRAG